MPCRPEVIARLLTRFAAVLALVAAPAVCLAQLAGTEATTVLLVRHAERESMSDPDSPLSAAGHARAAALARILRDAGVDAIVTSERVRTQQTAAPLATALDIRPLVLPGTALDDVVREIRQRRGQTILVVHHSNTIPTLAEKLGAHVAPIADDEFDRLIVVTLLPGGTSTTMTLRFDAPPR